MTRPTKIIASVAATLILGIGAALTVSDLTIDAKAEIGPGDAVMVLRSTGAKPAWQGPYRVTERPEYTTAILSIDGTPTPVSMTDVMPLDHWHARAASRQEHR